MTDLTELHNLKFSNELANFVENELLPGLDISSDDFWSSLSKIFYEFRAENKNFLKIREEIQTKLMIGTLTTQILILRNTKTF